MLCLLSFAPPTSATDPPTGERSSEEAAPSGEVAEETWPRLSLFLPLSMERAAPRPSAARTELSWLTDLGDFDSGRTTPLRGGGPLPFPLPSGIEPDGRIPRGEIPADIHHPERWRYIPEGLIPQGGIFDRFLSTTFITPILSFEEDVGTGGGIQFTDIDLFDSRRQMLGSAALSYTTEGQQLYQLTFRRFHHQRELEEGGILQEERSWSGLSGGYQRTLTRRFYGLGAGSRLEDESSYSEELGSCWLGEQRAIPHPGDEWVVNYGVAFERRNLGSGHVVGVPDTGAVAPGLFEAAAAIDSIWLTTGVRFDTRDGQHLPYRGGTLGLEVEWSPWADREMEGAHLSLSGSQVIPVPPLFHDGGSPEEEHPPIDPFAMGFRLDDTSGDLPFWSRPTLGGSHTLRGYAPDRFTDNSALHLVGEYRFWVLPRGFEVVAGSRVERFGLALFGEAGTVASRLGDLPGAELHSNVGVGLRMTFERLALLRIDVGFSDEGANLSVDFGLSF
ncbi:MAG: BamA/TamA family outer membrane protein [Planctomycetota bacterium]